MIGTSLIVTFADYYAGWNGIAIDAIVPILCSVTLVLNFILPLSTAALPRTAWFTCC